VKIARCVQAARDAPCPARGIVADRQCRDRALLGCGSLPESEWDHGSGYKDQVKAPRKTRSNHGVNSASIEAVCRKTRRDVNVVLEQTLVSPNSGRNYMSDKIVFTRSCSFRTARIEFADVMETESSAPLIRVV